MNRADDFYRQPSILNAYPIYGRTQIKQRGGIFTDPARFRDADKRARQNILGMHNIFSALLDGVRGYVQAKRKMDAIR